MRAHDNNPAVADAVQHLPGGHRLEGHRLEGHRLEGHRLDGERDAHRLEGERYVVAAEVLGHLAEPTRLHLLRLLTAEQDVSTLTAQVAASRSSVSQHLGRLRLAGLVHARRDGRRMLYRITSDHLAALVTEALGYADHGVRGIPHHRADD